MDNKKQETIMNGFIDKLENLFKRIAPKNAEMTLKTGEAVEVSELAVGGTVTIGGAAVPNGEHELADGTKIMVMDGKITEVIETQDQTDVEALKKENEEMKAKLAEYEGQNAALAKANADKEEEIKNVQEAQVAQAAEILEIKNSFTAFKSAIVNNAGEPAKGIKAKDSEPTEAHPFDGFAKELNKKRQN